MLVSSSNSKPLQGALSMAELYEWTHLEPTAEAISLLQNGSCLTDLDLNQSTLTFLLYHFTDVQAMKENIAS